jgi:uncharacterized membrane-anchored protein YitT (DUF2179 family)
MKLQSIQAILDGKAFATRLSRKTREWIFAAFTVFAIAATFSSPPVLQDPAYNHFADQRTLLGIPNLFDVISNVPLFLVGLLGLAFILLHATQTSQRAFATDHQVWSYIALFAGVTLAGLGSAYYHLAPGDNRLVWDRLPMTVIFMSFLAATISERISTRTGSLLLPILLSVGVASIIYWHVTELRGSGDLRVYLDVQYYTTAAIPLIAILFPSRYTRGRIVFAVFAVYVLAKVFELLDSAVYSLGHVVSGHVIKHIIAALGSYLILYMLQSRRPMKSHIQSAS